MANMLEQGIFRVTRPRRHGEFPRGAKGGDIPSQEPVRGSRPIVAHSRDIGPFTFPSQTKSALFSADFREPRIQISKVTLPAHAHKTRNL